MQRLVLLPPVNVARPHGSPAKAIHAGAASGRARAGSLLTSAVKGAKINGYYAGDADIQLFLEGNCILTIRALRETPHCELALESGLSLPFKLNGVLGEAVEVDWPKLGLETWRRVALLNETVGRTIARIAPHDFGTSLYLNGSKAIMFSSAICANGGSLVLYWGPM